METLNLKFMSYLKLFSLLAVTSFLFVGCVTRKQVVYLQGLENGTLVPELQDRRIVLHPMDKISIVVNSKDPIISSLFNLPIVSHRVSSSDISPLNAAQQVSLYSVSEAGTIDFPILGEVKVVGLTRSQVAELIKKKLVEQSLVKDPVVVVEFANLSFSVMGEVNRPGRQMIDRDRITILDALSMAGDLTIHGQRKNVLLLRQEGGRQKSYRIDLRSAEQAFASPAYYVQQNDIIYVEPNSMRARQSTVNGNSVLSSSFWMSLASLGTTIALLFIRK